MFVRYVRYIYIKKREGGGDGSLIPNAVGVSALRRPESEIGEDKGRREAANESEAKTNPSA